MGKRRRDRTPVVKVTARGSKRVSVAALITAKPGAKSRLITPIAGYSNDAWH